MKNLLHLFGIKALPVRRGVTSRQCVSLTFDDGPDPLFTPSILYLLEKAGVKATFFLIGERAKRYPEIVRRIIVDGHEIGNHTYSHYHPYRISPSKIREEIRIGKDVIESITQSRVRFFRPPYGAIRPSMLNEAYRLNQVTVLWSISGHDWGKNVISNVIEKRIINRLHNGGIILLHDATSKINNPLQTLQALSSIIPNIQNRRYDIVRLSELIRSIIPL